MLMHHKEVNQLNTQVNQSKINCIAFNGLSLKYTFENITCSNPT